MIEIVFYALVGLSCLLAAGNWRRGVYLGIFLDVLRDPLRKISADHPVAMSLAGTAVWAVVALRAWQSEGRDVRSFIRAHPQLRTILVCLVFALLPAAGLSVVFYPRGYLLAAVGMVSYLGPLVGIAVGFLFARSEETVYRLIRFYSIINTIALVGVPLEYVGWDLPGLGGIQHEWIRYQLGYQVELIAGFYRSPDIMGLHAAHVIMFSAMLWSKTRQGPGRVGWIAVIVWAAFCLLLSGRRKMIGIPLVFLASYLLMSLWRRAAHGQRFLGIAVVASAVAITAGVLFLDPDEVDDHTAYASSLFTEGPKRVNELVIGSTIETLQRVGVLGAGLGSGTQGRYYIGFQRVRYNQGWQEDGVSRVFLEFGIPGALLLLFTMLLALQMTANALKALPPDSSLQALQIGLASVVLGNAASFVISHQQYSGDPVSGLLAAMYAGMVLGLTRVYFLQRVRLQLVRRSMLEAQEREAEDVGESAEEAERT